MCVSKGYGKVCDKCIVRNAVATLTNQLETLRRRNHVLIANFAFT